MKKREPIRSHADVIAHWESIEDFSNDIHVLEKTARQMRLRGTIALDHWDNVIAAAHARGWDWITLDLLKSLYPPRKKHSISRPGNRGAVCPL